MAGLCVILMVSNVVLLKANAEDMQTEQFNLNHIIYFKNCFFHTRLYVHLNLSLIYIKLPLFTQMMVIKLNQSMGVLPKTYKPRFCCTYNGDINHSAPNWVYIISTCTHTLTFMHDSATVYLLICKQIHGSGVALSMTAREVHSHISRFHSLVLSTPQSYS